MPRDDQRYAALFGFVKKVRIVSHQQMGAMLRSQTVPIGLAHDAVINASEHEGFAAMQQRNTLVSERLDADSRKLFHELNGVAAKIIVIAQAEPCTERC